MILIYLIFLKITKLIQIFNMVIKNFIYQVFYIINTGNYTHYNFVFQV